MAPWSKPIASGKVMIKGILAEKYRFAEVRTCHYPSVGGSAYEMSAPMRNPQDAAAPMKEPQKTAREVIVRIPAGPPGQ
jgi:hypothetical protein